MRYSTLFFDLDDTLYPASTGLWMAIRERMTRYIVENLGVPHEQALAMRKTYYEIYGTTLRGLQHDYKIDPDQYLQYVHDLPLKDYLEPASTELHSLLLSLPQQRWIFTNADEMHARRVLEVLGLQDCFEGIIDIHTTGFYCKPDRQAYLNALANTGETDPTRCIMLDDRLVNLVTAQLLGFKTILVRPEAESDHLVDLHLNDLSELKQKMPELWKDGSGWT